MAWRPYENLIDGVLDNTVPGKVTGWMRFFRRDRDPLKMTFDLVGDFHRDIRGNSIKLSNPSPSDRNDEPECSESYVDGLHPVQKGEVGDITAGLTPRDYVDYPYIEWYSTSNGRVVLELHPDQVEVTGDDDAPEGDLSQKEREELSQRRSKLMRGFLGEMVETFGATLGVSTLGCTVKRKKKSNANKPRAASPGKRTKQ